MPARAEPGKGLVFLDACCLINLLGGGHAEEMLVALPYRFAVARYVAEVEVLEVGSEPVAERATSSQGTVSLQPSIAGLVERGVLKRVDIGSVTEQRDLVRFAMQLDDGEAHTCALALHRGARVATDDRKAIRVLRSVWKERSQALDVPRTSELLFSWAQEQGVSEPQLARIIRAIARRASFFPPHEDPHCERWLDLLHRGQ